MSSQFMKLWWLVLVSIVGICFYWKLLDTPKEVCYYVVDTSSNERSFSGEEPSLASEQQLRQVKRDVGFARERLSFEVKRLQSLNVGVAGLQELEHQLRVTADDLDQLGDADGRQEWREKEAAALSALVQHRLHVLQNPPDCDSARKIYCDFKPNGRGIGSQLHHLSYCFLAAYGTRRTLVLNTKNYNGNPRGLEELFLPLSDNCTRLDESRMVPWPGKNDSSSVYFPEWDKPNPRPSYFPRAIPWDLSKRLVRLHGEPFAWWMGQFFKFALRMNESFQEYLRNMTQAIGYKTPIVGVHIRRTDKLKSEAIYIPLESYMEGVEKFFEDLEMRQPVEERRVFLATDDQAVVKEFQKKYPNYVLVHNMASTKGASKEEREKGPNLRFLMADVYFLSRSNYLVCGMTSNACRLAYEIMQTLHPDASSRVHSVDAPYSFHFEKGHWVKARLAHSPTRREELELQKGDIIEFQNMYYTKNPNQKDGFLYGRNRRTKQSGLFLAYKTLDVLVVADDLPSYEEIDRRP